MARKVTTRQLELLLDFMEQHQTLALGRVRGREGNALSTRLWAQCANILNADTGGVQNSALYWKKYYNQYKSRTKAKQQRIKNEINQTGGGPAQTISLTPLENRLIGILGGCSSPLPDRHNPSDALAIEFACGDSTDAGAAKDDIASTSPVTDYKVNPIYLNIQVKSEATSPPPENQTENKETEEEKKEEKRPLSNIQVISAARSPPLDNQTEHKESEEEKKEQKRPPREKRVGPLKRCRRRRRSSPKSINKEFELAKNQLANMEQSRIQVDREMTQAIHRLASGMEEIASAIKSVGAAFVKNLSKRKRRKTRNNTDCSSTSNSEEDL